MFSYFTLIDLPKRIRICLVILVSTRIEPPNKNPYMFSYSTRIDLPDRIRIWSSQGKITKILQRRRTKDDVRGVHFLISLPNFRQGRKLDVLFDVLSFLVYKF